MNNIRKYYTFKRGEYTRVFATLNKVRKAIVIAQGPSYFSDNPIRIDLRIIHNQRYVSTLQHYFCHVRQPTYDLKFKTVLIHNLAGGLGHLDQWNKHQYSDRLHWAVVKKTKYTEAYATG